MKITVAMRVIGGFAIITLLLLIISLSSLFNINSIGSSVDNLNDQAVPALNEVAAVKVDILELGSVQLETFYDEKVGEVDAHRKEFEASRSSLFSSLNELNRLIQGAGQGDRIDAIEKDSQKYVDLIDRLFNQQREYLELQTTTASQLDEIAFNIDDAAIMLLDTMDMSNNEVISREASNVESSLSSLITLMYDLNKANKLDSAEVIRSEIDINIDSIRPRLEVLENEATGRTETMVSDAITTVRNAIDSLQGNGSYPANVIRRQQLRVDAENSLNSSQTQLNKLMTETDELQNAVRGIAEDTRVSVTDSISTSSWINSIITVVSIALAILISWYTVRSISQPLSRVNHMLNIMADGNLTERVDYNAQDEFGELASNTNKLTGNLRKLIEGIANRATQLATAAEESSNVSDETTNAIDEQRRQIEQVATATQEMNNTASEMADGADQALQEIQHSDDEAKRVREISDKNRTTIEGLAREIQSASEVIDQLSENSKNIGGILDVIRGIADQTNLLALNAAIEAARAGEQGRGFAVVADEVRTLASRTQESTEEIQDMIESLQNDSQRAVSVMNKGREQAELSVQQSDEAAQALQSITESVHQASDSSNHIANAAKEQSSTAHDISERLEAIVSIAEQTASGSKQTAQASNEVAKLADELQDSIKSFRV
ncbi:MULTISPECIES: methyl-accepting chemotaxis protein [Idiomarina]|jgi:methyl-accepting chemotaxis protein|uniref:HAMP domain-containing protein n=1 Tax=Idiomarina abyssalis TaxID=86102 RepID=A0A8I1G8I9_9GAMM|nr:MULTISPECIES: methyl-accepting chemotaxis protein [Idiomarina]KPD21504.1 chemotaxis protein [Idiomarina abyssalis]MAO68236.1 methyl-accepting chemotaxis protein [Idiomarina sp.]MBE92172.1 methyl-accepting chemotaxis protein [Idiomarina sp.]MBF81417.1 methyl-accepting chemotaxis protein [Idiomarina sp.]MBH94160.1 methyl-accepting chemotaxis protein [Idiomarina sp.]|tara:strand:- start:1884 stop:3884 length:2001 start_codon:yes stop_codon:yes gene_type:complete